MRMEKSLLVLKEKRNSFECKIKVFFSWNLLNKQSKNDFCCIFQTIAHKKIFVWIWRNRFERYMKLTLNKRLQRTKKSHRKYCRSCWRVTKYEQKAITCQYNWLAAYLDLTTGHYSVSNCNICGLFVLNTERKTAWGSKENGFNATRTTFSAFRGKNCDFCDALTSVLPF